MAKRKVNVVSNELDQAPKTRAAGYGKVINSMRKEINEAMDRTLLNGSHVIIDYIKHTNIIPEKKLLELQSGDHLSFEVKREEVKYDWFTETVWRPAFLWDFNNFTNNCQWLEEECPIKPGQKSTIIVVERDIEDPKLLRVHSEQLEYPDKKIFLMQWMYFINPNVSDEKFQEIISEDEEKEAKREEIKAQIKENINEEIEIEKMEEKEGKKAEQNKWNKSKDINFKERKLGEVDKK